MGGISESLLHLLEIVIVVLIYLMFFRVIRAVWAELKEPTKTSNEGLEPADTANSSENLRGVAKTLRVLEPVESRGREYQITNELTIGRAPGCHVTLDDNYASQLHARIFRQDGQAYVEDLGSTNGTFLNRRKTSAPSKLHHGDRLQVGRTVFEVRK